MENPFINQSPDESHGYHFLERTFSEYIDVRGFETMQDILFEKCTFPNFTVLESLSCRELTFMNCVFEQSLYISKSKFHSLAFFDVNVHSMDVVKNEGDVLSFRGVTCKNLEINGSYRSCQVVSSTIEELEVDDLNPEHSHRETKISFLENNKIKSINFTCNSCHSTILFSAGSYKDVAFEGEFKKRIAFGGNLTIDSLRFESVICQNRLDIDQGLYDFVMLNRCQFHGLVYFSDMQRFDKPGEFRINMMMFNSTHFEKDATIEISKLTSFSSSNCNYGEVLTINNFRDDGSGEAVRISFDSVNQGSVVVQRTYADIAMGGINLGNIYFNEIDISHLTFSDFENKGSISFRHLRSGNMMAIQESISGKLNFLNADINLFDEIVIANSDIDGANFQRYPEKIRSKSSSPQIGYGIKSNKHRHANLRMVYNQLKKIAKIKGDIDNASRFESLEHRELLLSKRFGFDTILLVLNFLSNNHGRSWFQALVFTMLMGLASFMAYASRVGINIEIEFWENYVLFFTSFPKLQFDSLETSNRRWDVQLVIWVGRIFISYGIYQTVAAFRKYAKS